MRPENWPDMLSDYLAAATRTGFVWGGNDCVCFGANWVRQVSGIDPLKGLRGRWRSARGALRVISDMGGTLDQLAADRLQAAGFGAVPVLRAGRGDVVAADLEGGVTIGIVADHRACFLTADPARPLAFLKLGSCLSAWRID